MHPFKTLALLVSLGLGSLVLLESLPAHALILSVGFSPAGEGGFTCADNAGNFTSGHPLTAYDCHAGPNQQFEFNGSTIFTLAGTRCVDVLGAGIAAGTTVDSAVCNGTVAQQWYYDFGLLINPHSGKCLDARSMANGTALIINTCSRSILSQNWQLK